LSCATVKKTGLGIAATPDGHHSIANNKNTLRQEQALRKDERSAAGFACNENGEGIKIKGLEGVKYG